MLTPIWGAKHSQFKAPIEYGAIKYGAIVAFKLEEKNGKLQLSPAWVSRDMSRAEPPVIANGGGRRGFTRTGMARTPSRPTRTLVSPDNAGPPDSGVDACSPLRARCANRQRAMVQRRPDRILEPLERTLDR